MNTSGRSLELFFVDGRPDGMLTAEVFNWTGHVLRVPRTQIKEALARDESEFTGVYVLLGEKEGKPLAYIGEGEDLGTRIRSHIAGKDWWETAVLITSAANNLHKAHVKYLESRLVEIATHVGTTTLENANIPPRSSLSEAAISNMESFLETLQMVLSAIRVDLFLSKEKPRTSQFDHHDAAHLLFEIRSKKIHGTAQAYLKGGEFVVEAGSATRGEWIGVQGSYTDLHRDLLRSGVIAMENGQGVFKKSYAFASPSAAAGVILGRSTNGRTAWRLASSGQTYAQWESDQLKVE